MGGEYHRVLLYVIVVYHTDSTRTIAVALKKREGGELFGRSNPPNFTNLSNTCDACPVPVRTRRRKSNQGAIYPTRCCLCCVVQVAVPQQRLESRLCTMYLDYVSVVQCSLAQNEK